MTSSDTWEHPRTHRRVPCSVVGDDQALCSFGTADELGVLWQRPGRDVGFRLGPAGQGGDRSALADSTVDTIVSTSSRCVSDTLPAPIVASPVARP